MNYLSINFGINRFKKYIGSRVTPIDFNEKELYKLKVIENCINSILEETFGINISKGVKFVDVNDEGDFHFNNFHSINSGFCDYKRYLINRKKLNIKYKNIEEFIKNLLIDNHLKLEIDTNGHWSCCEKCNLSGLACSFNCPNGVTLISKDYVFIQIFAQRIDDFKLVDEFEQKQQEVSLLEENILEKRQNFNPLGKNNRVDN